jgi:hypothetical protein
MLDAGEALPTAFTAGPPGSLARSMGSFCEVEHRSS